MSLITILSSMVMIAFMNSSHPIALMTLILIQTIMLCLFTWLFCKMSWFSYILFLIFLGGLMVLFVYIASLASNEKFNVKIKDMMKTTMVIVTMISITLLWKEIFIFKDYLNLTTMMKYMYSSTLMLMTSSTMIYLLLTLIVVVKMTSKYKGPMRSLTNKK